jgi:hypothetical protein
MRALYMHHGPAFVAPVVNFLLICMRTIDNRGTYLFPLVVLLLPAWITASIAWSEKGESEPLLRSLPLTDREVARTKFGLALAGMALYWFLITATAVLTSIGTGHLVANLICANAVWSATLLLAALWYVGIWSVGYHRIAPALVVFIALDVAATITLMAAAKTAGRHYVAAFSDVWRAPAPALWSVPVMLVAALLAYHALLGRAARARASGAY